MEQLGLPGGPDVFGVLLIDIRWLAERTTTRISKSKPFGQHAPKMRPAVGAQQISPLSLTKSAGTTIFSACRFASVAQLAEQLTLNQLVEGSSPSRGTTLSMVYTSDQTANPRFE